MWVCFCFLGGKPPNLMLEKITVHLNMPTVHLNMPILRFHICSKIGTKHI